MMEKKLAYLFLLLIIAMGCKEFGPTELDPVNEPQFWVKGSIDGASLNLIADGSYRAQSGFSKDSLDVTFYEAELIPEGCASCEERFLLRWRSHSLTDPSLDELMATNQPEFRFQNTDDSITIYNIELNAEKYGLNGVVTWDVLGETYTGDQVTIRLPEDEMVTKIPVSITANFDGCQVSNIDTIYLPNHGCDCDIAASIVAPAQTRFTAITSGSTSFGYSWGFKDSTVSASSEIVDYYYSAFPADGFERAELTVTSNSCNATRSKFVPVDSSATGCAVNFDYSISEEIQLVPAVVETDLTEIEIEYTNGEGDVYYTYWIAQPDAINFRLLGHEDYSDPNFQASSRSKKITASFNCTLTNGDDVIQLRDGELVLPLGLGAD